MQNFGYICEAENLPSILENHCHLEKEPPISKFSFYIVYTEPSIWRFVYYCVYEQILCYCTEICTQFLLTNIIKLVGKITHEPIYQSCAHTTVLIMIDFPSNVKILALYKFTDFLIFIQKKCTILESTVA